MKITQVSPSLLLYAAFAQGWDVPVCVAKCLDITINEGNGTGFETVCKDAKEQKSMFNCLADGCSSKAYGPAIATIAGTCSDMGARITLLRPVEIVHDDIQKRQLGDLFEPGPVAPWTGKASGSAVAVAVKCHAGGDGVVTVTLPIPRFSASAISSTCTTDIASTVRPVDGNGPMSGTPHGPNDGPPSPIYDGMCDGARANDPDCTSSDYSGQALTAIDSRKAPEPATFIDPAQTEPQPAVSVTSQIVPQSATGPLPTEQTLPSVDSQNAPEPATLVDSLSTQPQPLTSAVSRPAPNSATGTLPTATEVLSEPTEPDSSMATDSSATEETTTLPSAGGRPCDTCLTVPGGVTEAFTWPATADSTFLTVPRASSPRQKGTQRGQSCNLVSGFPDTAILSTYAGFTPTPSTHVGPPSNQPGRGSATTVALPYRLTDDDDARTSPGLMTVTGPTFVRADPPSVWSEMHQSSKPQTGDSELLTLATSLRLT